MEHKETVPLFINGEELKCNPEERFSCPCPFELGQVIYHVQGATDKDISNAAESSFAAFKIWKDSSYLEKRRLLNKCASLLEDRKVLFVKLLKEMGLPEWFASLNVDTCIGTLQECASLSSIPAGSLPQVGETKLAMVVQEPMGPILSIVPWNSPAILCMRAVVSPILAGCSVVVKSSELAPMIPYQIARLFHDSGFLPGLVNVIHHSPERAPAVTKLLIGNSRIRKITFTGSTAVGKIVSSFAAQELKPTLLELGGKCASIVTQTADLEAAANGIVSGAFAHNGQICMSTERVFVVKEVYDAFVEKVLRFSNSIGNTSLPQRTVAFAERIETLTKEAESQGCKVIYGKVSRKDAFLHPVIFADVAPDVSIHDTETFGPVFYINKVESVDQAIECVNASDYGLSCGLWATSDLLAIEIARKLDTGAVHINGMTVHDEPNLPHGGVKSSGFGRFNSVWGLSEFQYTKTITLN